VKKIFIILGVLCSIVFFVILISAEDIGIDDTLIVFDNREESESDSINMVAIAGWSADGKVAVIQSGAYDNYDFPFWFILDTITDEVLDAFRDLYYEEDDPLIYSELDKAMRKHNIKNDPGRLVELPYALPENMQSLTIEYREIGSEEYDVYAVRGNKRKKISCISVFGNLSKIITTFAVESPFKNRLLIITQVSVVHIEFDYTFFRFFYTGCHVTAGF
jgi:hypothetical protein